MWQLRWLPPVHLAMQVLSPSCLQTHRACFSSASDPTLAPELDLPSSHMLGPTLHQGWGLGVREACPSTHGPCPDITHWTLGS